MFNILFTFEDKNLNKLGSDNNEIILIFAWIAIFTEIVNSFSKFTEVTLFERNFLFDYNLWFVFL